MVNPILLMIFTQIILCASNMVYKLAIHDGMHIPILVAYRFMAGAAFLLPVALLVERNRRPNLTWKVIFYAFGCGLFGGSLGQNVYLKSLELTSVTFVTAIMNLVPAMAFIVAVCLRLESLDWNSLGGKAKVFGTAIGIGGAMIVTFYKGPELHIWRSHVNLLAKTHHQAADGPTPSQSGHDVVVGRVLSIASCLSYSIYVIFQTKVAEVYPCPYTVAAMMTTWASIQGIVYALCTEKDGNRHDWVMGWDIRSLTVAVSGILGSGVLYTLLALCAQARGPLFISIFNPLLLVMVGIAGTLFLEEKLHVGMVVGCIVIVLGLFTVLWGKSKTSKVEATQLSGGGEASGGEAIV